MPTPSRCPIATQNDLAALDALTDEALSSHDPDNPPRTAEDLANGEWLRTDNVAELLRQSKVPCDGKPRP